MNIGWWQKAFRNFEMVFDSNVDTPSCVSVTMLTRR